MENLLRAKLPKAVIFSKCPLFSNVLVEKRDGYHIVCAVLSRSVVSESATTWTVGHQAPLSMGILQARILEWVAHSLLQGIFPTQGLSQGLQHCRYILYLYKWNFNLTNHLIMWKINMKSKKIEWFIPDHPTT